MNIEPEHSAGTARQADWARRAAVHYLERYASSERHLERILVRKLQRRARLDPERWTLAPAAAERLIAGAIAYCRELGLVDDRRFAETKIASGRRKGHSASRIKSKMAAKGVSGTIVAEALGDGTDDDERAAITYARRRRLGPFRESDGNDPADRRRDVAALCRQGFAVALSLRVVSMDRDTADALLEPR